MLEIKDLRAGVEGTEIIKGISLSIKPGQVHAIMGVNGSGKSTLANVIAGREDYEVTAGSITFCGKDLLEMEPDERACAGVFLAFQYPVELPGVNSSYFLRTAVNSVRKARGESELNVKEFSKFAKETTAMLDFPGTLLGRSVNEGFSGGEKKRNEIFQLAMLQPKLAVLDETDSGLDIDALKIVAAGVNKLRNEQRSFLVITHYQRLLNYIVPDVVHVMIDGKIVRTGDKQLALDVEQRGYNWIRDAVAA